MTLIEKLQAHVDMFSVEIPVKAKEKDYLTVGGVVTHLFDPKLLEAELEEEIGIYMTIDDGLGTINLIVPRIAYSYYMEVFQQAKVGNLDGQVILVKGYYTEFDKSKVFETKSGGHISVEHPNNEPPKILVEEISLI